MSLLPTRQRKSQLAFRRSARLSPVDRSAVLRGAVIPRDGGDDLDQFFRLRLIAAEDKADASVQRVDAARRDASKDGNGLRSVTEDVLISRGNSGNGCLNSRQLAQPTRNEDEAADVRDMLDDPNGIDYRSV